MCNPIENVKYEPSKMFLQKWYFLSNYDFLFLKKKTMRTLGDLKPMLDKLLESCRRPYAGTSFYLSKKLTLSIFFIKFSGKEMIIEFQTHSCGRTRFYCRICNMDVSETIRTHMANLVHLFRYIVS